jgi:hypothetical protein
MSKTRLTRVKPEPITDEELMGFFVQYLTQLCVRCPQEQPADLHPFAMALAAAQRYPKKWSAIGRYLHCCRQHAKKLVNEGCELLTKRSLTAADLVNPMARICEFDIVERMQELETVDPIVALHSIIQEKLDTGDWSPEDVAGYGY